MYYYYNSYCIIFTTCSYTCWVLIILNKELLYLHKLHIPILSDLLASLYSIIFKISNT